MLRSTDGGGNKRQRCGTYNHGIAPGSSTLQIPFLRRYSKKVYLKRFSKKSTASIQNDIISGDTLCSDVFKIIEDVFYKVHGDHGEAYDVAVMSLDIVLALKLVSTSFNNNSDYLTYLKCYTYDLKNRIEADGGDVEAFIYETKTVILEIMNDFDELAFFTGESMVPVGMVIIHRWEESVPYLYYLKMA